MRGGSLFRIAFFGSLVALVAVSSANCQAKTYITCGGLCESVLPCNDSYDECIAFCAQQQKKCEGVGHPAAFLAYIACTTDAGFTCNEAGDPVANAPCGPEQAELVQCEAPDADAALEIPDGAFEAGLSCPDAGSCLACCEGAYPTGAKEYAAAVASCVCGDSAGSCRSECVDAGVCAHPAKMPAAGDACDTCLTAMLNEQASDAGACVVPVTLRCNAPGSDCYLYVNCVTQPGCTS